MLTGHLRTLMLPSTKSALTAASAGACLSILGQIYVELGDIDNKARRYFLEAVEADEDAALPDEIGGGPEKFLGWRS